MCLSSDRCRNCGKYLAIQWCCDVERWRGFCRAWTVIAHTEYMRLALDQTSPEGRRRAAWLVAGGHGRDKHLDIIMRAANGLARLTKH